jgi:fimbrial chaperone protein
MRAARLAALATLLSMTFGEPLWAASLQVAPVSIEVTAPGAGATIKLHNEGTTKINTQIRVFRWVQIDGQEKLQPTDDVVASPPMARLGPGADYTVRIVRLSKQPMSGEESYRLLIDELPDQKALSNRVINLVLRYSIPVFFLPPNAQPAKLTWSLEQHKGRVQLSAVNEGDRHVRLAALNVRDRNGTSVSFGPGLTGYVLGRSRMQWVAPATSRPLAADNSVEISAVGDTGPIHALPAVRPPH